MAFATKSFLPVGLLAKKTGRARSHAIVTGHVAESKELTNAATGRTYRALRVATYGGELDIVATQALLPDTPDAGAIVRADCWLSGRLVPDL